MVKNYLYSTLISLAVAQILIAEEDPQDVCMPIISETLDPCCMNPMYPYPANYTPYCGWDIYAQGDFLYLSSTIDPLTNPAGNFAFDTSTTKWLFPHTPYRPGFRVAIGVDLDSVVLDVTYLRYHSHTTTHFHARPGDGIAFTFGSPSFASFLDGQPRALFERMKVGLHIDLDYLLASLERPVYLGKRILMNLTYGILGTWAAQKWHINGFAFTTPIPPVGISVDGVYTSIHKSWAVGPNLGFTATALLPWHLQLIGGIDLSLQYAEVYNVRVISDFPNYPGPLGHYHIKKGNTLAEIQAFHAGEIGLGWGDYLGCDDRYHVNISVTYNWLFQHIYGFGQPFGIPTGWDGMLMTDTSVHGIAVGGRVDF